MAILRTDAVIIVDGIPTWTPGDPGYGGATLARLVNTNTWYIWNASAWITIVMGDDTAYDATTWNGNLNVPTMNAIRDKIEALMVSGILVDGDYGDITISGGGTVISIDAGLDAAKIGDGTVSNAEFQYLNGVTSGIQAQLDAKAADADVVKVTGNQTVAGTKTFSSDVVVPDEVYDATAWDGSLEVPTKNAIRDKIEAIVTGSDYVHTTGNENIAGVKTFADDPIIPDEAYSGSWNGSLEPPTKNAVYDQMETKAADSSVVHKTGNETVGGVKTFSSDLLIPDEVYSGAWDGVLEPPTKNAVYDQMETRAKDTDVVHLTGNESIGGTKTFSSDVIVPDESYDATNWNGNLEVPTKNAIRDKLEAIFANLPIAQYKVLLTQTGTSAPTEAETHSNTLGGSPALARPSGAGTYTVTLLNAFPVGKCQIQHSASSRHASVEVTHTSASVLTITVKANPSDVGLADLEGSLMLSVEIFA